jgi:uncharacterized protein (TIGR02246 family)
MYRPHSLGVSASAPFFEAESAIRGLAQDFCTAFNTGNYDHAAALFASDAFFVTPFRKLAQGAKLVERELRAFGEAGYENLRFETGRVDSSGDLAIEIGHYSVAVQRETAVTRSGNYMRAWRRFGIWLITAECWSSDVPLADEHVPAQPQRIA